MSNFNPGAIQPSRKTPRTPKANSESCVQAIQETPTTLKLSSVPKKLFTRVNMDPLLQTELHNARFFNIPNFVEHIFPDSILPLSVRSLEKEIMDRKKNSPYDRTNKRWTHCPNLTTNSSDGSMEGKFATFLDSVGNTLVLTCQKKGKPVPNKRRRWVSKYATKVMPGGIGPQRKPDIILAEEEEVQWSGALGHAEMKTSPPEWNQAITQLINGAYLVFSSQDERRFHLGISFCAAEVRLFLFDRAGLVGSDSFDLHTQPSLFIRLIAGLVLTPLSSLGFDPTIIHKRGKRFVVVCKEHYEIIGAIFMSDVIRGRGTVCWHGRKDGVDYVIKDTWADTSRTYTEADILLRAKGIEGVPQIVAEEIVHVDGRIDSTADARTIIDRNKRPHGDLINNLEVRVHRRLVMTPYAQKLTAFKTKKELISVFIDAIEAHQRLLTKDILHRDISIHNIMMHAPPPINTKVPNCSKFSQGPVTDLGVTGSSGTSTKIDSNSMLRNGLVIDVDYAALIRDPEDESRVLATGHRTGTLPFMAGDILTEGSSIAHMPHHDLESFIYVLIWICVNYAGPGDVERQNFDIFDTHIKHWISGSDFADMGLVKLASMTSNYTVFNKFVLRHFAPYFEDLRPCVEKLRQMFFKRALDAGHPTHQELIDILRETHDELPDIESWSEKDDPSGYGATRLKNGSRKRKTWELEDILEENERPKKISTLPNIKRITRSAQAELEAGALQAPANSDRARYIN